MRGISARSILFVSMAATLIGCATHAQQQAQTIRTNTQSVAAQLQACVAEVYNSPDAEPLRPHFPVRVDQATLQQLTDPAKATDLEIAAIYTVHPRNQPCRQAALEGLSTTTPTIVPIMAGSWERNEEYLIDLIQRKISWGDYVRHAKENGLEMQREIIAEGQRIDAGLQQSHEAELARRQAAANAMVQFSQNQQLINSLNRPTTTNCVGFGNMMNCHTQ